MKTLLSFLGFLLFISTANALPPSEGTRVVMAHYKETYDFNNWPGKDTPLIAAPDLKQHEIPSLVGAYEIFGDSAEGVLCEFYSDSPEDEYVVRFFYRWSVKQPRDVYVTFFVATSAEKAQEYMLYIISWNQGSFLKPHRDETPVAGYVSFNNGAGFVRNNIAVFVSSADDMYSEQTTIAHDIDAILIDQPSYGSLTDVLPRFSNIEFTKLRDRKAIITPSAFDPLGGSVMIKYRLGGGIVYQKEGDTIYYQAGEPGSYTIQYIAVAESGYHATHTLKITATENDIFN